MKWDMVTTGLVLGGGALVAALGPGGGLDRITKGPQATAAAIALARKWGVVFGLPAGWILAICRVESNYRPGATNLSSAGDVKRGGAWGIMQVTLATATGAAPVLARSSSAEVAATMAKWDGQGKAMLDIDVGMMFGAYHLSRLKTEFNTFEAVATAYNHGAGALRKRLQAGQSTASSYATKATAALNEAIG